MKVAIATLFLALLLLFSVASASRCLTLPSGERCCGLAIATFSIGVSESFAQSLGYFKDEGLNVCFYKLTSSVFMYDTLLANGTVDFVGSNMDNAAWRKLNFGLNLTVVAGTDGARGFYLIGNTKVLNGYNSVAALSGKNIVVDSVDSGFVTGLRKVLYDYGVTNFTFIPYGNNRLQVVQAGYLTVNGVNVTIAATMQNNIAPYLFSYPVVNLAQQAEHFCPSQGTGYVATNEWLANQQNHDELKAFFRALLRSYVYLTGSLSNTARRQEIYNWIKNNTGTTDPNLIELIYDDYFINPATGLNNYLIPRKAGMRNILNARVTYGMSPAPAEGVESLLTDKVGGFVDLSALREALNSLSLPNNYDTDDGLTGCPIGNKGTIVPGPPMFTCTTTYDINSQPPQWPTGMTATITIAVSNASLLIQNGQPGWSLSFTAKGSGTTPAFHINQSWNNGGVTAVTSGTSTTYTFANADYNAQSPSNIGFNADTVLRSPYNNICGVRLNGIPCPVLTPATASTYC